MISRLPETRYARSGDVSIAYQVIGDGPLNLVFVMGWVSNVASCWEEPSFARFLRRLASFSRLILFDKRGTGLSDRVATDKLPTLEIRMDDVRAVMDAADAKKAALFGISEGAPLCALFAATYPDRTSALIMNGGYARRLKNENYPWGMTESEHLAWLDTIASGWGGPVGLELRAPSRASDAAFRNWWATYLVMSASPAAAVHLTRMNAQIDIRHVLPAIRVPTLILHATRDRTIGIEQGRFMAEHVAGSKLVELDSDDHLPWASDSDRVLSAIEEFLTGTRHVEIDRILATVLFTDIVDSTQRVAELGDQRWRDLLEGHHALQRRRLDEFRGRVIDTAGDGLLAAFDGPARAIRCAQAMGDDARPLGLQLRSGLHTGECELVDSKLRGLAVHIGARVAALAEPGQVWVSSTVKDLVAGSGIDFEPRGRRSLKGVPGTWELFSVIGG
jgi:pimeloyl-ACP methyl ester carboxylesterase